MPCLRCRTHHGRLQAASVTSLNVELGRDAQPTLAKPVQGGRSAPLLMMSGLCQRSPFQTGSGVDGKCSSSCRCSFLWMNLTSSLGVKLVLSTQSSLSFLRGEPVTWGEPTVSSFPGSLSGLRGPWDPGTPVKVFLGD